MHAVAEARANIALVKYWGKAQTTDPAKDPDLALNLPSTGSLSLTLSNLVTRTSVAFSDELTQDELFLDGERAQPGALGRAKRVLDAVRERTNQRRFATVRSKTNFPVASGLASSASGMAALALAASAAAGIALAPAGGAPSEALQDMARIGSGSAVRSLFGGFVEMSIDGHSREIFPASHLDVAMVVAIADTGPKAISSRQGMLETAQRSAYYPAWVASHEEDLVSARSALASRDLAALGTVMERNCLKMHAAAMAAGIIYFKPPTLLGIECVRELRSRGLHGYFTVDAGPHVKVLCPAAEAETIQLALARVPGFAEVRIAHPGAGAQLISSGPDESEDALEAVGL